MYPLSMEKKFGCSTVKLRKTYNEVYNLYFKLFILPSIIEYFLFCLFLVLSINYMFWSYLGFIFKMTVTRSLVISDLFLFGIVSIIFYCYGSIKKNRISLVIERIILENNDLLKKFFC